MGMENAVTKMQLTAPELIAARDLLCQADMLVDGVRSLFFNIGNSAPAARLKDIEGRLQDEVQVLERLITKAAPNGEQERPTRGKCGPRRDALQGSKIAPGNGLKPGSQKGLPPAHSTSATIGTTAGQGIAMSG